MLVGEQDGMTLARVRTFLQLSGADKEASNIVDTAGIKVDDDPQQGYDR